MHLFFLAVLVVGGMTAAIVLGTWLLMRDGFKMIDNPAFARKRLIFIGILYSLSTIFLIIEVLLHDEPPQILLGLPIAVLLIWNAFNSARRIKLPPKN